MRQPSPYSERSGFVSGEIGLAGLMDTEPHGCLGTMPHYKSGTAAKLLDKVKFTNGYTQKDGVREDTFAEGVVVGINPGATCCELTILSGSLKVLGSMQLQKDGVGFSGVCLEGWYTTRAAADCWLV